MEPTGRFFHILTAVCLVLPAGQGLAASPQESSPGQFACGQAATAISLIQGAGPASPLAGSVVDVEAVVVGVFQQPGELGGLFLQEEDADQDQDARTSEGVFAHTSSVAQVGDLVRLRGTVAEFKGLTELHPVTQVAVCRVNGPLPTPAVLQLPVASADDFEAVENMWVSLPQTLVITDHYQLWQFGELVVSSTRLVQPTQLAAPGEQALKLARSNAPDRLIVDDGRSGRNLPVAIKGQDNATSFSAANSVRTGQEISGLSGVMYYDFDNYRLQPTRPFTIKAEANARTAEPDSVGGTLRVSSFNVLNYFSTLDDTRPQCGPFRNLFCRGARNPGEQQRQLQKLTAALSAIDADILALIELENNPDQSLRDIAEALNSLTGDKTWSYVETGSIGQDAIKVGLLFKPAAVTAVGHFALLGRAVDARFDDALSRPALAQSFHVDGSDVLLTVIVTHLKSKRCSDDGGADANQHDGQECFNRTRTEAAAALADWALSDPTGTGAAYVLVLGDFNSYRMEDPIRMMRKKSFVDLLSRFDRKNSYTYVYDGLAGTLDYAFGNSALAAHVTGITAWHINADESHALDYRDEPGKPKVYHAANAFRSSDHDPLIIGLDIGAVQVQAQAGIIMPDKGSPTILYALLAGALVLLAGVRIQSFLNSSHRGHERGGSEG